MVKMGGGDWELKREKWTKIEKWHKNKDPVVFILQVKAKGGIKSSNSSGEENGMKKTGRKQE